MTYSPASISALVDRIGWNTPVPPYTLFTISAPNLVSLSGRRFFNYHKLATTEYVADCMPNASADENAINAYLADLKQQAVYRALTAVFDGNDRAFFYLDSFGHRTDISTTDYSSVILANLNVFDELIGLSGASIVLELIKNSDRSNIKERLAKAGISLFNELEGFYTEYGKMVGKGLFFKLETAKNRAIDVLFPMTDRKPALRFTQPW